MVRKTQHKNTFLSWKEFLAFVFFFSCFDILKTATSDLVSSNKLTATWQIELLIMSWFLLGAIFTWAAIYFDKKRKEKSASK